MKAVDRKKAMKWGLAGSVMAVCVGLAAPAQARDCSDLGDLSLENGRITSAQVVGAGEFSPPATPFGPPPGVLAASFAKLPAFCRVQATLTPSDDSDIKVEVWLPADGWNGKFVGLGNGIWAGQLSISEIANPLSRGYAVATTDTGHVGNGLTADFAVGHPEKLVDFAYRAVHEMTVTAKSVIGAYYGRGPDLSLWNSCSTGGRQGLMSAFRYPEDYDAISAMAPANPMTDLMVQSVWANWVTKRPGGGELSPAVMGLAHTAAVKKCDAQDGLEDGLISRPATCDFDPVELQCKPGEQGQCLSSGQVNALRGLYSGVRASDGTLLLPGFPIGSEMQLSMLTGGPAPFPVAHSYFQQLVYGDKPAWDWMGFDYRQGLADARTYGGDLLNIPADGLDAFFARGGKLLLSHGWNDGLIPAGNTLAFYSGLYADLPLEQAQQQLRLFMAPGMDHCSGGEGPNAFDTIGVIDSWATSGIAPNRIIARREPSPMPGAPQLPPMSRPLCPYPLEARYTGEGDILQAENFTCQLPE